MPKLLLQPHPEFPSPATRVEVEMARVATDRLRLVYSIFGDLDEMVVPPARAASRADELWKHTCLEVFLAARTGYQEFNFSPSSQWAAYRFEGHRAGRRDAVVADPVIEWRLDGEAGRLTATFELPLDLTGEVGLSAIIEEREGNRSFWALAHPQGDPDFHDAACFTAQLPPAG